MASTKKAAAKKVSPLPKGFVPARQALAGFFAFEAGNSITGILRGSFPVKGKFGEKRVYRIEIVEGSTQIGQDGEVAERGDVVGLDETGYTRALSDLEQGSGVYVRYEGKSGEGQQDPHIFTVGKAC